MTAKARLAWPQQLALLIAAAVIAVGLAQTVRSGSEEARPLPELAEDTPIEQVNQLLLAEGWQPQPEQTPLPMERQLAHNQLTSLSACSGTGLGYCRYDYQRGQQRFAVVTVPDRHGNGRVIRWFAPE